MKSSTDHLPQEGVFVEITSRHPLGRRGVGKENAMLRAQRLTRLAQELGNVIIILGMFMPVVLLVTPLALSIICSTGFALYLALMPELLEQLGWRVDVTIWANVIAPIVTGLVYLFVQSGIWRRLGIGMFAAGMEAAFFGFARLNSTYHLPLNDHARFYVIYACLGLILLIYVWPKLTQMWKALGNTR